MSRLIKSEHDYARYKHADVEDPDGSRKVLESKFANRKGLVFKYRKGEISFFVRRDRPREIVPASTKDMLAHV